MQQLSVAFCESVVSSVMTKPKATLKVKPEKPVTVQIPRDLHDTLSAWCKVRGHSLRFAVEKMIRKGLGKAA